jgi:hypothetical protein
MSSRQVLETAMRQLEEIFVLYSRNTITDTGAVSQQAGTVSRARQLSNSLTSNADDAVFLNRYVTEVLPEFVASSPGDGQTNPAQPNGAIIVYHNAQKSGNCDLVLNGNEIVSGYVADVTVNDILGTIAQKNTNINKNVGNPQTSEPSLGIIEINSPFLSLPTRNVVPVSLFCSSIPTIELSRALPFANVRVVSPINGVANGKAKTLSIGSFLMGQDADLREGTVERDIAASSRNVALPGGILVPSGSIPGNQSVFGMEMFTMPQTLINADLSVGARGTPILDKFRPLMSIVSLTVQVMPAGHAAFAYKEANINIKIHDRSRMQDVAQLLRPDMFGFNFIELEYGWAHPEDVGEDNPYAAFINSFRQRELYTVISSNVGMEGDGSVNVSIRCGLKGMRDLANMTGISDQWVDVSRATEMFERVNKTVSEILADTTDAKTAEDIRYAEIVRSVSRAGASGRFGISADELDQIKAYLNRLNGTTDGDLPQLRAGLVEIFGEDGTGGEFKKLNDDATRVFNDKINSMQTSAELKEFGKRGVANKEVSDTSIPYSAQGVSRQYVTFGKFVACMLGSPLTKGSFAEVQLYFYTFNSDAGAMNRRNIAEFPIPIQSIRTAFAEPIKLDPKMPLRKMMRIMLTLVNESSAPAYGMDQPPKLAEGQTESKADVEKRNATNAANMESYGCRSTSFKRPMVEFMMDSIAIDGKPVLRIHFFDKRNTPNDEAIHLLDVSMSSGPKELLSLVSTLQQGTQGDTSVLQEAARAGIVNVNNIKGKETYTLNTNSKALKNFLKRTVPSITYGTPTSVMMDFNVQSIDMQDLETALLKQAAVGTRVPGQQQLDSPQNDMQIYPMNFSTTIFGCPLIDYAQEFFIDLDTGTSLDNIYVVNGVTHNIDKGRFTTSLELKLTRTTSAASAIDSKIRSLLSNIDSKTKGAPES